MKTCNKCGVEKELDQFRVWKGYVRGECKACAVVEAGKRNPEALALASRTWYQNNKSKAAETKRNWRNTHVEEHRAQRRKILYGISVAEHEAFLKKQNGGCAICNRKTGLCVDHCHVSGKVRGLLCKPCNTFLGVIGDSLDALNRSIEYLKKPLS